MADEQRTFRCAIYTRKSTDEGLEQDFNSLQAQREACEAFIRSQRSEGWKLVPAAYDDGGISGGTMERPALRRLMADIQEKRVDVVVVYKVDRLTRSLSDFSKMVEVFDRHGVSFVAVTQQFNTTTSMGRLTLNVLLSFAQFEREVTAERIRDKIAASKRKGIWMGGGIPRGYRVEDRKLIVVPEQAAIVNHIFRRYLDCPSIRELSLELKREGIATPTRIRKRRKSGEPEPAVSRGALYALLRNPIYVGLISHKGELFPGQHEGIVDREIWDAAQEKLEGSRRCKGRLRRKTEESPLMGKLFDERGRPLTPTHANKKGRRYRYYVSHSDALDDDRLSQTANDGWKLSARDVEARVGDVIAAMVSDSGKIAEAATAASMRATDLSALHSAMRDASAAERLGWVERVDLSSDGMTVAIQLPGPNQIRLAEVIPMVMKRRGIERKIVIASDGAPVGNPDPRILRVLSIGLRFWENLMSEQPLTAVEFAKQEGVDDRFVGRTLPLALLAPQVVTRLAAGNHSPDWTSERLIRWQPLPLSWNEQADTAEA
ncbi:MAG: recombinase family protein [Sinimarinibacterium flocculans]|uniref:recombinase family protein n=1 Tax=Sinimarinibacterium flocculans TaxID=985250 RepID=UPI003C5355D7